MLMDSEDISYKAFMKMIGEPVERFESWFMLNPENGDMWVVPVKDLPKLVYVTGCILPHKMGWWPVFNSLTTYGYEGCSSNSGVQVSSQQVMKKGVKVVRGPSWGWGTQADAGIGIVTEVPEWGEWVRVDWPNETFNKYRWGYANKKTRIPGYGAYDIMVVSPEKGDISLMNSYKRVNLV